MTSKIRVLTEHTINKIAAGEVIENPSSVVKELVENSIDAGATDICIEIQGGGRQLIRISDNGCGMNRDDALLCLERHATSKIREVEEIHTLTTMGFRGEAIPSIASISKFSILTCSANDDSIGTMVIIDGGKLISCTPAARSQGTTMEVKGLFFNVPVRKKFLKSPAVDANEILKMVSLIALGYPEIKFQLISDGKNLLSTKPSPQASLEDKLKDRISDVLGQDFVQNTVYLQGVNTSCQVQGFIGLPSYTRHNRTGQYLFINQRGVTSPSIAYAVRDGYGTALSSGRHPVFVLNLMLPGDLVDVNVHPQKREVRLRHEQAIKELIIQTVQGSLHKDTHFINASTPLPTISPVFAESFRQQIDEHTTESNHWVFRPKPQLLTPLTPAPQWLNAAHTPVQKTSVLPLQTPLPKPAVLPNDSLTLLEQTIFPPKVLATLSCFIILDSTSAHEFITKSCPQSHRGGLILVHQKRAHARIIFEKLLQLDTDTPIAQQVLLIPQPIELPPFEAEILRNFIDHLNILGIHIQEFAPNNFLVDAVPQIFGNSNIEMLLKDIINDLREIDKKNFQHEKAKQVAQAASRASISHNRRLSLEQAQGLIDQLIHCKQPYQCPTGKQIIAQMSPDEITKLFQK